LCINNFGVDNGVSEGELMDKEADDSCWHTRY
jgi:hypothetical protein